MEEVYYVFYQVFPISNLFFFFYTWWGLVERIIFEDLRYDKLHLIIGRITKFQNLNFQVMKKFYLGNVRRVFLGN